MRGIFELPMIGKIEIACFEKNFYEFAKRQLYCYFMNELSDQEDSGSSENIKNTSRITIDDPCIIEDFKSMFSKQYRISRNIKIADGRMSIGNVTYQILNGKLEIIAFPVTRIRQIKIKAGIMLYGREKNYARYHALFYQYILFPIYSLYSMKGYYLLHGSIIEYEGKTIVLSGLDGVGKSSLANELQKKGALLEADNFVLWNGKQVLPFQLAVRLEPEQESGMQTLYADRNVKEVIPVTGCKTEKPPAAIFIILISEKLFIEPFNLNEVYFSNFLNNAVEIGAANSYLSPFYLEYLRRQGQEKPENRRKAYLLGIPKGKLDQGAELIRKELLQW